MQFLNVVLGHVHILQYFGKEKKQITNNKTITKYLKSTVFSTVILSRLAMSDSNLHLQDQNYQS